MNLCTSNPHGVKSLGYDPPPAPMGAPPLVTSTNKTYRYQCIRVWYGRRYSDIISGLFLIHARQRHRRWITHVLRFHIIRHLRRICARRKPATVPEPRDLGRSGGQGSPEGGRSLEKFCRSHVQLCSGRVHSPTWKVATHSSQITFGRTCSYSPGTHHI